MSLPKVVRIEALCRNFDLQYRVVVHQTPTAAQLEIIKQHISDVFKGQRRVELNQTNKQLEVRVTPSDSLKGKGNFAVYNALRKLLHPTVPYAALAQRAEAPPPPGTVAFLGVRLIGDHQASVPRKLMFDIQRLSCIHTIEVAPGYSGFTYALTTKNPQPNFTVGEFQAALQSVGLALTIY